MYRNKVYKKLETHLMICEKFIILAEKIKRYFIAPIHPKLEIRRNKVAPINELCVMLGDRIAYK